MDVLVLALALLGAKPQVIHCRYTAIVLQRERFEAFAVCTRRYTVLRVEADRPFLVRASNARGSSYLACKNLPTFGRASRSACCTGSVRANAPLTFEATTNSLCEPIRISFTVTSPFENSKALTLRGRC